jgi:hypothetical protein
MLARMRHGSRRRTLKSRDLDIAPPAEVLEARGAAARQRPQPVGQRSGGGQQAVTTLRTRPQDGCGRCVPPPLVGRPQRHLLHAVRGKRICDLKLLRNKGHPTAAIVCSRPSLRIIRRRHARTQRSLTTHTLCARGQCFSHTSSCTPGAVPHRTPSLLLAATLCLPARQIFCPEGRTRGTLRLRRATGYVSAPALPASVAQRLAARQAGTRPARTLARQLPTAV